jgi:hypothetical protein
MKRGGLELYNNKEGKLENEVWKPVYGFESFYICSNLGRIRSLPRSIVNKRGFIQDIHAKFKKAKPDKYGNLRVTVYNNKNKVSVALVHTLIAKTFLMDSYFEGAVVYHKNYDKTDNCVENLEWRDYGYVFKEGYKRYRKTFSNDQHWNSKIRISEFERVAHLRKQGWTQKKIADYYGISQTGVSAILRRMNKYVDQCVNTINLL